MLNFIGSLLLKAIGILCFAFLLAIGFWLGRKLTDKIDQFLLIRREVKNTINEMITVGA